jgi:hypothetical protein
MIGGVSMEVSMDLYKLIQDYKDDIGICLTRLRMAKACPEDFSVAYRDVLRVRLGDSWKGLRSLRRSHPELSPIRSRQLSLDFGCPVRVLDLTRSKYVLPEEGIQMELNL